MTNSGQQLPYKLHVKANMKSGSTYSINNIKGPLTNHSSVLELLNHISHRSVGIGSIRIQYWSHLCSRLETERFAKTIDKNNNQSNGKEHDWQYDIYDWVVLILHNEDYYQQYQTNEMCNYCHYEHHKQCIVIVNLLFYQVSAHPVFLKLDS